MPSVVWTGQVSASLDSILYIGPLEDGPLHHHPGYQAYIALEGNFEMRTGPDEPWERYTAVIIESDQLHALRGNDATAAMVLVEPLDAGQIRAENLLGGKVIKALPEDIASEFSARLGELGVNPPYSEENLLQIKHILLSILKLTPGDPENFDERISKAQKLLQDDPGYSWTVKELATRVGMSDRHFRHVFGKQAGIPPRRYIKWARVTSAAKEILAGESVGKAAIQAGFADAGHLTRSFRELTGALPTSISKTLEAHFTDEEGIASVRGSKEKK